MLAEQAIVHEALGFLGYLLDAEPFAKSNAYRFLTPMSINAQMSYYVQLDEKYLSVEIRIMLSICMSSPPAETLNPVCERLT